MSKLKSYEVFVKTTAEWSGTLLAKSLRDVKRFAQNEFNSGGLQKSGEEVEAVIAFKRRRRCGSWPTFERRFRPIDSPDHTLWWSREQLPKEVDPHRVWTITDCDGRLYVAPGFHFVNRIDYVLCDVPWSDEDFYQPSYRYD